MNSPFLTAEWRNLVMFNYEVDPVALRARVPYGVELDTFEGRHYVSIVGFQFVGTKVLGYEVPLHRDFPEVNLRFYVRRKLGGEWRRGVVFIKELVPRAAIAIVARVVYNEPYRSLPMSGNVVPPSPGVPGHADYRWRSNGREVGIRAEFEGEPRPLAQGSELEFITEHYYGYGVTHEDATLEYRVEHPAWRDWAVRKHEAIGDLGAFYNGALTEVLRGKPRSVFVAEGSPVSVYKPERLESLVRA